MEIKLLAFDLDNTLFNRAGQLESSTLAALHRAMAQGVQVTIATGRMYPSAKIVAQALGTKTPIICYNGACLRSKEDAAPRMLVELDATVQREIVDFCKARGLFLQMYHQDKIIVEQHNEYSRSDPDSQNAEIVEVGDFTKAPLLPTPKMMIYNTPQVISQLETELKAKYKGAVYIAQSMPHLLEIMDARIDKSFALARLAEELGIPQAQVAAFGDNSNDLEMVRWAGWGVAVANAIEPLKAAAQYVCTNPRNKGVEEFLQKFVFSPMPN